MSPCRDNSTSYLVFPPFFRHVICVCLCYEGCGFLNETYAKLLFTKQIDNAKKLLQRGAFLLADQTSNICL